MIASIRHKGLKLFWTQNDGSKLPYQQLKKIKNVMLLLNSAAKIEDLNFPGANLHSLKGEFSGFWAVSVTGNYRIIFEFIDGWAHLIDYIDYH